MTPVDWYFARGNKQMGPVSAVDLKRLAAAGELLPDDLVWREGLAEWTKARNVRGLFEEESKPAGARGASFQSGRGFVAGARAGRPGRGARAGAGIYPDACAGAAPDRRAVGLAAEGSRRSIHRSDGPSVSGVRPVRAAGGDGPRRRLRRDRDREDQDARRLAVGHRPALAARCAAICGRQVPRRAGSAQPRERRPPGVGRAAGRRGAVEPGGGAGHAVGTGVGGCPGVDVSDHFGGNCRTYRPRLPGLRGR